MASLKANDGYEFLAQAEGDEYEVFEYNVNYVDSECSGFDDMFPTINPYTPANRENKCKAYPDHGEIFRIKMQTKTDGKSVEFFCSFGNISNYL